MCARVRVRVCMCVCIRLRLACGEGMTDSVCAIQFHLNMQQNARNSKCNELEIRTCMTEKYETTKRLLVNIYIYSETSTNLFTITFYSLFESRLMTYGNYKTDGDSIDCRLGLRLRIRLTDLD